MSCASVGERTMRERVLEWQGVGDTHVDFIGASICGHSQRSVAVGCEVLEGCPSRKGSAREDRLARVESHDAVRRFDESNASSVMLFAVVCVFPSVDAVLLINEVGQG